MKRIAIVTDSTCDIPATMADRLDIHVVPNIIVIDGQEYEDGKGLTREEFYTRLPRMKSVPTTATASPGAYQTLYEQLLEKGFSHIISIHTSSLLSGIFNAASTAAQAIGRRVFVVDSRSASFGLGFQVLAAAEAALQQPVEAVLELLGHLHQHIRLVALLDTLEYLRRSGRVSWARARLGNLLHIKPIIRLIDGKVVSLGETRTRSRGIERLAEILHAAGDVRQLAILHTNAEADARQLAEGAHFHLDFPPLLVNITTVIGTHVGPNGLGFVALLRW